jgi:single-strand DNA-binding protein
MSPVRNAAYTYVPEDLRSTLPKLYEWHRIVLFGKQAEIFGDRAVKGALIQVEGSLQTRDWTDRDGNKRYTTETVARLVQVLGKREHPVTEPPASEEPPTPPEAEVPEDDIPF